MESLRTSSRTYFKVLGLGFEGQVVGLGLEASSPRKLPYPRLEDRTIFWSDEILLENARNLLEKLWRPFLFPWIGDCLKKNFQDLFSFGDCLKMYFFGWPFFEEHLRLCPWSLALSFPVLGLEMVCPRKGCPWPWPRALCPRLHLCIKTISSVSVLAIICQYKEKVSFNCDKSQSKTSYANYWRKLYIFAWRGFANSTG